MESYIALSRRSFLAAAVAAGCVAGHSRPVAGANDTVNVGILGCGHRGVFLMETLVRKHREGQPVRVAAVCDVHEPRAGRAGSLASAEVVPRWQDLVTRHDLDAVLVATPDHQHAPMALAAMESGKDVYCETPMARTLEEGQAFVDCAHRMGRVVQIGAWEISEPSWHAARETVRAGRLGRLVWCHADCRTYIATEPGVADWRGRWDCCDGVAAQAFYPKLAALLSALKPGLPSRVSALGGVHARDGRETPDRLVMTCVYPGGPTVVLASTCGMPGTVLRGERGDLDVAEGDEIPVSGRPDHLDNWLACIRTRETCACSVETGYQALAATCMGIEAYRKCGLDSAADA